MTTDAEPVAGECRGWQEARGGGKLWRTDTMHGFKPHAMRGETGGMEGGREVYTPVIHNKPEKIIHPYCWAAVMICR